MHAGDGGVRVKLSQEKWDKTRQYLEWLQSSMDHAEGIEFKQLEWVRGFLVHVAGTYPTPTPYLKLIHLTLDSWREVWDAEGWKVVAQGLEYTREGEAVGRDLM